MSFLERARLWLAVRILGKIALVANVRFLVGKEFHVQLNPATREYGLPCAMRLEPNQEVLITDCSFQCAEVAENSNV